MLECVANVSEGRNHAVVRLLAAACGRALLDVHVDIDHNRSVFTLAWPRPSEVVPSMHDFADAVAGHVSIAAHSGVHPRFGALDVVPFVAFDPTTPDVAISAANDFATWWSETFDVPVFFYGDADPRRRDLPSARREAFHHRVPDLGPRAPHPALGATAVGVRPPLVAVNCVLASSDTGIARDIARHTRGRDGGIPGVRALGIFLESVQRAQVSMNVTDLERTSLEEVCTRVRQLAQAAGSDVTAVELVGLVPRGALERCSKEFREWSGLDAEATIESRLSAG